MKTLYLILLLFVQPAFLFAQITHHITFSDIQTVSSATNEDYVEIQSKELYGCFIDELGVPNLPAKNIKIAVPFGCKVEKVELLNPVVKFITLKRKILPFQGYIPTADIDTVYNFTHPLKTVYEENTSFPKYQISNSRIDFFDYDNHVLSFMVCPFSYNALENELAFFSSFDIKISYKEALQTDKGYNLKKQRSSAVQSNYDFILKKIVDNPEDIQKASIQDISLRSSTSVSTQPGYEYVVITGEALAPFFNSFVDWKRRKGINIGVVTMEWIRNNYAGDLISGIYDDAGKLRQFLFDAYSNGLQYALLGGDKNVVPVRVGYNTNNTSANLQIIPTDLYFADFNGDWNVDNDDKYGEPTNDSPDYLPEIFIGRILCSTAQHITNWTEKLIKYETNPGDGDFDYLTKAFYTQADQMQSADWASQIMTAFPNFITNTVFEESATLDNNNVPIFPTGQEVMNEFNSNYGMVSFLAHGSPCSIAVASNGDNNVWPYNYNQRLIAINSHHNGLLGSSLSNMNNQNYPNINYSISCETMPFDDNIDEHIGHNNNLGKSYTVLSDAGNVAYLGNTRQGYVDPSCILFQYFGYAVNGGNYNIGVAESVSKTSLNNNYYRYLSYCHNLLGCPEMEMWTDIPSYFNSLSITSIGSDITVNCGGVSGCTIAFSSKDNGETYFEVARNVSSQTFQNVNVPCYITITKHNYIPYLACSTPVLNIANQTIIANTIIQNCGDITIQNVEVTNSAKLKLNADGRIFIDGQFSVEGGSGFEVER